MQSESSYQLALERTRSHLAETRQVAGQATSEENVRTQAAELNDVYQAYEKARLCYVDDLNRSRQTGELAEIFRTADDLKSQILDVKSSLPSNAANLIISPASDHSSVGTSVSSAASMRIRAQAQKARLQSELSNLQRKFQLEEDERRASQKREMHRLQGQLEAVISELNVYEEIQEDDGSASFKSLPRPSVFPASSSNNVPPYANEGVTHSYNLRPRDRTATATAASHAQNPRAVTVNADLSLDQRSHYPTTQQQDVRERVTPPSEHVQHQSGNITSPAHRSKAAAAGHDDTNMAAGRIITSKMATGHVMTTKQATECGSKQTREQQSVSYNSYYPYDYQIEANSNDQRTNVNELNNQS